MAQCSGLARVGHGPGEERKGDLFARCERVCSIRDHSGAALRRG